MEIVCDMDGVLVDFVESANRIHGRPGYVPNKFDYFEDWGLTAEEFWAPIDAQGPEWWKNITFYPWAEDLLDIIARYASDFVVATACSKNAYSSQGKVQAIQAYFGEDFRKYFITPCKHYLAKPGRVLIDDYEKNTQKFLENDGNAILFPRPWNENRDLANDPLPYVVEQLEHIDAYL